MPISLNLEDLSQGCPGLTPAYSAALAEASAVCLDSQGHQSGVMLEVTGDMTEELLVHWPDITEQMRRCWHDEEYTTEQGAYGIACLIVQRLTPFTIIERSIKGTGFDYWLGDQSETETFPFQRRVRLEVSGIRRGNASRIRARVEQKRRQTQRSDGSLPVYVIVVEFSTPVATLVQR